MTTPLIITVWISAIVFGLYIILYYLNSWIGGDLARWIEYLRFRYPIVHRWIGRLYIAASFATAIGGLIYILPMELSAGPSWMLGLYSMVF